LGRTILVADDSPTIQKKASGILTGEGLDVVTVSNGVAAVKKLSTVNPVVVLADVSMPGKDGYEVCEYIKSDAGLSSIFVLLIFSDTDPYEEAKGARVSADGIIKKPFEREELVATVAKFVNQAEAARPLAAPPPPQPPPAVEVDPIEEEQPAQASPAADLAAFSGGVAFGVPTGEETPSIPNEPMVSGPQPAEPQATPEEPVPSHDAGLDAIADSAMLVNEPEPALVSEPEVETPRPELIVEHEGEAEPQLVEEEPTPSSPEQSAERTMMFRTPADIAQPILRDELEPTAPVAEAAEAPAAEPAPSVESVEPEPVSGPGAEMVAEPPAAEAPVAEAEAAPVETPAQEETADVTPPEGTPIALRTLDGYTLREAVLGHVRFAAPEAEAPPEAPPEPEAAVAAPEPKTETPEAEATAPEAAAPAAPDPEQIFSIVHKAVVKMSPPALSLQMIEDIARRLTNEILADLHSES
jgi:CheY-like chemotaxis protein